MKIYMSGPMTGYPEFNYPVFRAATAVVRAKGHSVYCPSEFPYEGAFPARRAFAAYAKYICEEADAIVLLPGWRESKGATTEHGLAVNCGLRVFLWPEIPEADTGDNG